MSRTACRGNASSYNKRLHGPAIAASVGLPALRATCPVFHRWVTRLEAVA
ncbi:MAG: DUF4276 family protein [Myxococcales bacterium]|nr:DUF4276 family protein [Myxococcales bacterium]